MKIENKLLNTLTDALKKMYAIDSHDNITLLQKTKKEFEGDFTIVLFPFLKMVKKPLNIVGEEIGNYFLENLSKFVASYNIINGFLNLVIKNDFWNSRLTEICNNETYGFSEKVDEKSILIEFSSPNTNKPLHLGHIRNNLLGSSIASILEAAGKNVVKVNLVNDRGIHICKSMTAWLKFGNGETPESANMKGDHLVGKYYVLFDKKFKEETSKLVAAGLDEKTAEKEATIMKEAQDMLKKWENNDFEVCSLWKKMNNWVYAGFEDTYNRLGISFDKTYYESSTYLLGKEIVFEGLKDGTFYKRDDGSVWVDCTDYGMDEKLLLRSDGTSVYITQDMGTALLRYDEFQPQKMIYVVGNEQIYHFDILKIILKDKLKLDAGNTVFHLSYGMVELPDGKMKSREGTVVDADILMEEMFLEAKNKTEKLGKNNFSQNEAEKLYETIGMGALKYFILKVDPKKNMLFNPEESIDFNGNTAPFIQYTHARICSMLKKAKEIDFNFLEIDTQNVLLGKKEKEMIKMACDFPNIINSAAVEYSPANIANYLFDLSKTFNNFYQDNPILKEEDNFIRATRLKVSMIFSMIIKTGLQLLGIDAPKSM